MIIEIRNTIQYNTKINNMHQLKELIFKFFHETPCVINNEKNMIYFD